MAPTMAKGVIVTRGVRQFGSRWRKMMLALVAPATAAAASDEFGADIDAVIDAGPTPGGSPSTIVDARGTAPRLVREGAVAWDRVLQSRA